MTITCRSIAVTRSVAQKVFSGSGAPSLEVKRSRQATTLRCQTVDRSKTLSGAGADCLQRVAGASKTILLTTLAEASMTKVRRHTMRRVITTTTSGRRPPIKLNGLRTTNRAISVHGQLSCCGGHAAGLLALAKRARVIRPHLLRGVL